MGRLRNAVAASIGAKALQSAMKEPTPASLARVRGNERTAKRRLSESKLKFCEALAPTIPWASQRSKTNFQRKTARAVFVSRARGRENCRAIRLAPPARAGAGFKGAPARHS